MCLWSVISFARLQIAVLTVKPVSMRHEVKKSFSRYSDSKYFCMQ